MSALGGMWRIDGRPGAAEDCKRILAAQQIYGPDAEGQWAAGGIAIGRRLKRLLPEDIFDHQPIVSRHQVLVADVRLDNRDDLAHTLQIPPERARNLCDAAILFAALERWGEDCFSHLAGDYAFALWNEERRSLLLARDPFGQRPLHYHRGNNLFAFASMPKGLNAIPEIPHAPDEERIAEFLVLMPAHGSRTFFAGIERVEPGHTVTVTQSGISTRRYWNPRRHTVKLNSADEYAEALRAHLDEAVRCRLRGSGDIGVYMSGGLDSTAVAATAARLLSSSPRRVIAFTAVPRKGYSGVNTPNRFIDEGPHAAAVAALYPNMEHVLVHNENRPPLPELDGAFYFNEQPLLNLSSASWGSVISQQMRARNLKIGLSGSYGNFGLSFDGAGVLAELIRTGHWLRWATTARNLTARTAMRWRGVFAQSFGPWCPEPIWVWLNKKFNGSADSVGEYSAIHPGRLAELDLETRASERGLDFTYRPGKDTFADRIWCLRRLDPGNPYKGNLASEGIDFRDPTADIRLVEFCLTVPVNEYVRGGVPRALARNALADRLPKVVLEEQRKGLQAADWREWLLAARKDIASELERLDSCEPAARALDLPRLHQLMSNWPQDGWEREDIRSSYDLALLRGISVGHFLRRAAGGNA